MTENVSFAGITFEARHDHTYLTKLLSDYLSDGNAEFSLTVTPEMTGAEREISDGGYTDGYLESLALYRAFCTRAAERGVILFHSCVMESDGKAYLFAAPSGTGKTTHARLWMSTFGGGKMEYLNGDKPLLRVADGVPTVYGTPFMGKENYGHNGNAPIGGICFLERGRENSITRITSGDAFASAMAQLFIPESGENAAVIIQTMTKILNSVPLWKMKCNISEEAAKMSFSAMTGKEI